MPRSQKKFALTSDVLRHTFISMCVTKFRSLGEAALQAGKSEAIIRKHYLDLNTSEEAEQFFGIMPKHATVLPKPVFTEPVDPKHEARALTIEVNARLFIWMPEDASLEERGVRATVVL